MTCPHTQFSDLPTEIKLWILEYACGGKGRIVKLKSGNIAPHNTRPHENIFGVMHTCREWRNFFLTQCTSAVGLPQPGWRYSGDLKSKPFKHLLRGLKARMTNIRTLQNMPDILELYMNSNLAMASEYSKYATQGRPYIRLSPPLWFDADLDTLLVTASSRGWERNMLLHYTSMSQVPIRHIAFEVENLFLEEIKSACQVWHLPPRKSQAFCDRVRSTKTISNLSRFTFEVFTFALDETSSFKPGQWPFRLDTESRNFAAELQDRWSNVTWQVKLGRSRESQSLWEGLHAWGFDAPTWSYLQMELCKDNPDVEGTWMSLPREHFEASGDLQLVPGGDGQTYFGPAEKKYKITCLREGD